MPPGNRFNKAYFDKWYRGARRVRTAMPLARQVSLAVSVAEYVLERPLRRVLDVGCGEGIWRAPLRKLRPRVEYFGLDTSDYAVSRFGMRRNIGLGSFGALDDVDDLESFDLVTCVDALHYMDDADVRRGARVLGERLNGVAYLYAFARGDAVEGDVRGMIRRPAKWYRSLFRRSGLLPVGFACWVGEPLADALTQLESVSR